MPEWLALERQILFALTALGVLGLVWDGRRPGRWGGPIAAAAFGAAFFTAIHGVRLVVPTEYEWAFQGDWRIHFLGWHFFQHEGWHWPPGRVAGLGAPIGTAIGLTDSIPFAAFLIKPLAVWLPTPFQYIGIWLLFCFTMQGLFGALIAARWTPNAVVQALAGACFVVVPALLVRDVHPALCSHWLLLWAIWLYVRADAHGKPPLAAAGVLAIVSGLIHPYLAAMCAGVIAAIAVRMLVEPAHADRARAWTASALVLAVTSSGVVAGWWASGLFTVSGSDLVSVRMGETSINLLSPVAPIGWSALLPDWWKPATIYWYETFNYQGAGLLLLFVAAAAARFLAPAPRIARVIWPLGLIAAVLTLYALGPRIQAGDRVLAELAWLPTSTGFRSNGRFFWPAGYIVLAASLGTLIVRAPARVTALALVAVLTLQVVDLRAEYTARRDVRHQATWYQWPHPLTSPLWREALPHYDHMLLYRPPQCGEPPTMFEDAALLAGSHGLTINGVLAARIDTAAWGEACVAFERALIAGEVDDRTIYLGSIELARAFRDRISTPLTCGAVDGVGVCVTTASYAAWRDRARLE